MDETYKYVKFKSVVVVVVWRRGSAHIGTSFKPSTTKYGSKTTTRYEQDSYFCGVTFWTAVNEFKRKTSSTSKPFNLEWSTSAASRYPLQTATCCTVRREVKLVGISRSGLLVFYSLSFWFVCCIFIMFLYYKVIWKVCVDRFLCVSLRLTWR